MTVHPIALWPKDSTRKLLLCPRKLWGALYLQQSELLSDRWWQMFPLHRCGLCFRCEMVDSCFILCHNPKQKVIAIFMVIHEMFQIAAMYCFMCVRVSCWAPIMLTPSCIKERCGWSYELAYLQYQILLLLYWWRYTSLVYFNHVIHLPDICICSGCAYPSRSWYVLHLLMSITEFQHHLSFIFFNIIPDP